MIYTLIHGRDPIPCRTTYIEYRSPVKKKHHFFEEHHLLPLVSIAKYFFHSSTTPVVGGSLRWAWKTHFIIQYKKKLIISWGLFFWLKRCSFRTSDIQGCYSPKGIMYMIFTLWHGRDPIPRRTTYIEYRSPVKIFINFLRNTTQVHWFSWQNIFFIILRHRSWGVPFGEPEKLNFFIQYKKKLIISGDLFFFWNVLI